MKHRMNDGSLSLSPVWQSAAVTGVQLREKSSGGSHLGGRWWNAGNTVPCTGNQPSPWGERFLASFAIRKRGFRSLPFRKGYFDFIHSIGAIPQQRKTEQADPL
jgi:hypothetical protein